MSELMLHGVLNMPIDLWREDDLDKMQRHSRYVEASETIRTQQSTIDRLTEQRDRLVDWLKSSTYEVYSDRDQIVLDKLIAEIEA